MADLIETPRLTLEPLTIEDAEEMVHVLADPALHEFVGGRPLTLPELRARYVMQVVGQSPDGSEEWLNWIARVRSDRVAIGYVQATMTASAADVAWVIGTPWQGNGYASEAASALVGWLLSRGTTNITAHVHPDHRASAAVARHAGLAPTQEVEDGEVVWRLADQALTPPASVGG